MKNIKYNETQEALERLIQNANMVAGELVNNDDADAYYDAKTKLINEMASKLATMVERMEEREARKAARLEEEKAARKEVEEAKQEEPRKSEWHHDCAFLPCGRVKRNGESKDWGTIWDLWPADYSATNILVMNRENGAYRLVHTSDNVESVHNHYRKGDVLELRHDQDMYRIGMFEVVDYAPHHKGHEDLVRLFDVAGKNSLPFGTFK